MTPRYLRRGRRAVITAIHTAPWRRSTRIRAAAPLLALLAALLVCLILVPARAVAAPTADPAARISSILRTRDLDVPGTAVYVWDIQTGRQVYDLNAATPLHPASNLKLVTSAAALLAWGSDHRIATQVLATADPGPDGVLHGDLYLCGLGDPSFSTGAYQREVLDMHTTSVGAIARRLKAMGLRRISGGVVGDASWFDHRSTVATWRPGLADDCGRLSALTVDESLDDGGRVANPALYAARQLTRALRARGIKVAGKPSLGTTPPGSYLLLQRRSAPLSTLLRHMDKDSDNFFAEMLTKGLGRDLYGEGTTDAGLQALRGVLEQIGAAPWSYRIADGSGLSYESRLTAGDLVKLLVAMYRRDDFDTFYDALAVAGVDGTLEERMRGTAAQGDAHAKTGTLDVAAALSGYVTSRDGHLLAFSILVNGEPVDDWRAMKAQDAIVAALAASRVGGRGLRTAPGARQHVQGATDPSQVPARALVPCPEVPAA